MTPEPRRAPARFSATRSLSCGYRRRQPETTLLYRVVAAELDALREELAAASPYGRGLPRHVERELEAYLRCGQLGCGFARVVCRACRAEHLVALSCKGRGVCPSCTGRRMHDTAAHLVDRVIPRIPMRQWVVTFPRRVRYHLAADPRLASEAIREVMRAVFAFQRGRARQAGHRPSRASSNAAIVVVQRFNSGLDLSLHLHALLPDGVFIHDPARPDAPPAFIDIGPPTDEDLADILDPIIGRLLKLLRRRGRLEEDAVDEDPEPHLLFAASPASSHGSRTTRPAPTCSDPPPRLCIRKDGFSLHAGTAVHPNDRRGLERLARYCLRPALALDRLTQTADGSVLYDMKRIYSDGRRTLRFTPRELVLRLCALVPPPRFHQTRYFGIFSAHARGRHALTGRGMHDRPPPPAVAAPVTLALRLPSSTPETKTVSPGSGGSGGAPTGLTSPAPGAATPGSSKSADARPLWPADAEGPDDPTRGRRLDWARLMARTYPFDVSVCKACGGPMRVVAFIEHEAVARHILDHLGLASRAPPRGRGFSPGQQVTLFGPRERDPWPDDPFDGIDPPSPD